MNRLFGVAKKKPDANPTPAPTLNEASSQMDERVKNIQEKIRACDQELLGYKQQMAKGDTIFSCSLQYIRNAIAKDR